MQFLDRMVYDSKDDFLLDERLAEKPDFDDDNDDMNFSLDFPDENVNVNSNPPERNIIQPPKRTCVDYMQVFYDIILLPCFHIIICSKCWNKNRDNHAVRCSVLYKNKKKGH